MTERLGPAGEDPADTALFDRLRALWIERDPVPDGLADDLVAAVAADTIAWEWELLVPSGAGELVGVRAGGDVDTLEFELGAVSVMVRVSPEAGGTRRIDGWITEGVDTAEGSTVWLTGDDGDAQRSAALDRNGRFEFTGVGGRRRWRLRFALGDDGRRLETPDIEW